MRFTSLILAVALTVLAACGAGSSSPQPNDRAASPVPAEDFIGDWSGRLKTPTGSELEIILHIESGEDEDFKVALDVPEQGAVGLPGKNGHIDEDGTFLTDFPVVGASLNLKREGDELVGTFFQGIPLPITFKQGITHQEPARPQEDALVRDYEIKEITFRVEDSDVILAGEITLPRGEGPFPGVVLISGSGPQNRNEELMGHKPFLILSDHLTRNGFAVLRYDDRGTADSTGSFRAATTQDFAKDAAAALRQLQLEERVDQERLGYIGHSEGGFIAPLATQIAPADFMVFLAGPSQPLPDVILRQSVDLGKAAGMSDAQIEARNKLQAELFGALKDISSDEEALNLAKQMISESGLAPPAAIEAQAKQVSSPWMRWMISFDPRPAIAAYNGPVLALFAEKDLQVAPDANIPDMEAALAHPQSVVKTLPGLNHLFQPAETGAMTEYYSIETTFDEDAMEEIVTWIRGLD